MRRATRGLLILALALSGGACSVLSGGHGSGRFTRTGSGTEPITSEEIRQRGPFANLYDLVQVLRPRWLRSQGPDTFVGQPGQVQVHMDGNHLGSVDVLRRLSAHGVTWVEWLPPIDAGARFGLDHSHGAIIISTRPVP